MSKYIELLKDPRWQKRRLQIMELDEFTCQICYNTQETLNVHHLIYLPGKNPWEYDDRHLITLCETCHKRQKNVDIKAALADLSINASTFLIILAALKQLIPEFVTSPRTTEQAIWSFCFDSIRDRGLSLEEFYSNLKDFREKYGEL